MDEQSTSALQYGHLGRASYCTETQTWEFSRKLSPPPHISYEGITRTTVPSPLTASQTSLVENKSNLRKVYPELAACWPLVKNETLSHVITKTAEYCDPLVTSLLDLGHAVNIPKDDLGRRAIPIAVVASGECGNAISFRTIEEDIVELRRETPTEMRVPSIGKKESIEWCAGGAPVRQICFARTLEEKATWMAARFQHSTTIFRPQYHRQPAPVYTYHEGQRGSMANHRNSRLHANPLVEVSHLQTGGFPHADVTFNPWYPKQFALVDERGNWSIWEISGGRKKRQKQQRNSWAATCLMSRSLPWLDLGDGQAIDGHPRHDGWAKIEWAGDYSGLLVSDRRCSIFYRMQNDQTRSFSIELDLDRKSEWILDIKRSPGNASHIFLLTTSRVFWLDVSPEFIPDPESNSNLSLCPRLSWRHFRDPEDVTLQLTALTVCENVNLVLYSRLNHFVQSFHCPTTPGDTLCLHDPLILKVPPIPDDDTVELQSHSKGVRFSSLVAREIDHSPVAVDKKHYSPRDRFVKLFVANSNLSVCESIYTVPLDDNISSDQEIEKNILRLKRRHGGVQREPSTYSGDELIVDERDDSTIGKAIVPVAHIEMSSTAPFEMPQWTINFTQVYLIATGRTNLPREGEGGQPTAKGLHDSIETLESAITNTVINDSSMGRTMLEFLCSSPLLDDIDQNAQELSEFLSKIMAAGLSETNPRQFVIQSPADPPTESSITRTRPPRFSEQINLVDLYDRLANDWLANLPHDIPGRTRIMKEKVIRGITADLALSRITALRHLERGPDMIVARNRSIPDNALSNDSEDNNMKPNHSRRPGLSSFTTFREQSLSRNATNMLHHWRPGADPDTYSWQRTTQTLESEETGQESTPTTPKRRLRKKASMDISVPSPASSANPVVWDSSSQPDYNERPMVQQQWSSQVLEEELPMTQVERGTFGGREATRNSVAKARKKRRAAGF